MENVHTIVFIDIIHVTTLFKPGFDGIYIYWSALKKYYGSVI